MKILMVGANGYGAKFLQPIYDMHKDGQVTFEGVVTRSPYPMQEEFAAAGIPTYKTLDAFYAEHSADLAVISTPAFLHKEQSVFCVEHGSNVLCEKPAAPTVEEVKEMIRAEERTGKFIGIGFQASYGRPNLELKKDILEGKLGKPISMKAVICSSRTLDYYGRGDGYAGRISKNGRMLLDSVASNACAHYLHNMLFLLGDAMDTSAFAYDLTGECYRANDIENFDTCTLKMKVGDGVDVFYGASHANASGVPYTLVAEFEKAEVRFTWRFKPEDTMIAYFKDGSTKDYGNPNGVEINNKLGDCIEAVRTGTTPVCTVKTALPHIQLIEDIYKTIPTVSFPEDAKTIVEGKRGPWVAVPGLAEKMTAAFERNCLYSEV